jgi:hypothetical protein
MGTRFRIPIGFVEGLDTGDGRHFKLGQWLHRDLPLSLMTLFEEPQNGGHGGAKVTARIDEARRWDITGEVDGTTGRTWGDLAGGQVWGWTFLGEFADDHEDDARRAVELIRGGFLTGVSADLAEVTWEEEVVATDEEGWPTEVKLIGGPGMIGGLTVVNVPAFRACRIELLDEAGAVADLPMVASGMTGDPWLPSARETDAECVPCREGTVLASGGPLAPPASWFTNPGLPGPTPLTVDDDGRIFGHLASWGTCHTGMQGRCVTPPRSLTGYSLFRVGAVRTAEGTDVAVGHITLGGGHADLHADVAGTLAHYDDAGTAVADVAAGEDEHGIWVAGALRPDVTDAQVRALRAAPLSGDWRRHGSGLELVAALAVNVPGFPVVRSVAASGAPLALVAAGAQPVIEASRPRLDDAAVEAAVARAMAPYRLREARARLAAAGVGTS